MKTKNKNNANTSSFNTFNTFCIDKRSSCGLSIIGNIKIYQCHVIKNQRHFYPQWRSTLSITITEMLLLPKFDNSSPFVTRDKEICHMIMSQRHSLPPEAEYPM